MEKISLLPKIYENYFELEKEIIYFINETFKRQFNLIYDKLSDDKKLFFNPEIINEIKLVWIFNPNTIHKNRGDICSSTVQKFYHSLFNEYEDDEVKRNIMGKFRSIFCELFQTNLILSLNNQTDDHYLSNYVDKFEFKNGFLNIFFKRQGVELLDKTKDKKKSVEKEIQEDNFNVFFFMKIKNLV